MTLIEHKRFKSLRYSHNALQDLTNHNHSRPALQHEVYRHREHPNVDAHSNADAQLFRWFPKGGRAQVPPSGSAGVQIKTAKSEIGPNSTEFCGGHANLIKFQSSFLRDRQSMHMGMLLLAIGHASTLVCLLYMGFLPCQKAAVDVSLLAWNI